jgi:NaMN:DMB phosphoribosyltransferase
VLATSPRKSKGVPVPILVDVHIVPPEAVNIDIAHQWVLSKVGAKFQAGQAATRSKRTAMLEQGVTFHAEHTRTICKQRRESARR